MGDTDDPQAGPAKPRGRGRPANTSTDDTVATVLAAARRQFAAHGYAGTSNQTVANAAGLAHTAIYNHFGSKARLFTAVFVDVQDRLVEELDRSVRAAPDDAPFPGALLDAIEALRDADPSYVEFLASMYTEVRRQPELRAIFKGGQTFPILDKLHDLAAGHVTAGAGERQDDAMWFWIAFALGLAQLSTLADQSTFAVTVEVFRRQFATLQRADTGGSTAEGQSS
ncbi:MAG: TetR/AcrR family transcriptional regulator [Acidimicrobiia bacterium]